MEPPVNLLPALENGLFALGQVLRLPRDGAAVGLRRGRGLHGWVVLVDYVARIRERRGFDVTSWLKSGAVLDAPDSRRRALPSLLRRLIADVEVARQEHRIDAGGLEHLVLRAKSDCATASTRRACW